MAIGTPAVGTAGGQERTAETSTAVLLPATVNAGDQLLIFGSVNSAAVVATPSGWTLISSVYNTANTLAPSLCAFRKTAVGTEGGTTVAVAHGNTVSEWQAVAVPGVDTNNPLDVAVTTVDNSVAATTSTVPGQTIVTPGAMLFFAATQASTLAVSAPPTAPGTFTEIADRNTGSRAFTVAYLGNVAAGATGSVANAWTNGGSASNAKGNGLLVALRPAPTQRPVRPNLVPLVRAANF